jgi:hypothetical protein
MEQIWQKILKHRGDTFYLKKGKPFTYSQGKYEHMYVDNVKLSFPLTYNEFLKALKIGRKDRLADYEHVVAPSYIYAILNDPKIGAWGQLNIKGFQ